MAAPLHTYTGALPGEGTEGAFLGEMLAQIHGRNSRTELQERVRVLPRECWHTGLSAPTGRKHRLTHPAL